MTLVYSLRSQFGSGDSIRSRGNADLAEGSSSVGVLASLTRGIRSRSPENPTDAAGCLLCETSWTDLVAMEMLSESAVAACHSVSTADC